MRARDAASLRRQLSDRDLSILEDLRAFRLLTARHLQRLHFPVPQLHQSVQGASKATHRALNRLESQRVIFPLTRRIGGAERGSSGRLWQLTEHGIDVLQLGSETRPRRRILEPASQLFLDHTVAVASLGVELRLAAAAANLEALKIDAEPASWKHFMGNAGQPEHLRPDLYVVLADRSMEQHSFIEVDLGTEHAAQLIKKCHVYARYDSLGAASRDLGVMPRVIWAAETEKRRSFIERTISAQAKQLPDIFIVTTIADAPALTAHGLTADSTTTTDL